MKEKYKVINRDVIKYIAVFFMFWGHLFAWIELWKNPGLVYVYDVMPLWKQVITHFSIFCPPVMFFMAADGYKYSHDRRKYAVRLFIFAAITQLVQCIIEKGWESMNVIFTMFFGLIELIAWESRLKKWQRVLIVAVIWILSTVLMCEWLVFGTATIFFLHLYREDPKKRFIAYTSVMLIWKAIAFFGNITMIPLAQNIFDSVFDFAMVMLAYLCMTVFYNGKKGRFPTFSKWFFYIFYPAHYIVIYAVVTLTS